MPAIAWIGIVVSFLVALVVVYFIVRSLITLVVAKREVERPRWGVGVVEVKGPKRSRRAASPKAGARQGRSEEDSAMREALEKLERRARAPRDDETRRRPGRRGDS